jgi:uncharacterized protein YjbJ (UPF0337 family)
MSKFKREMKSTIQKAKGCITEAAGDLFHNPSLKQRGKTQQAMGQAQSAVDNAVERVEGKVEHAAAVALDLVMTAAARIAPQVANAPLPSVATARTSKG